MESSGMQEKKSAEWHVNSWYNENRERGGREAYGWARMNSREL